MEKRRNITKGYKIITRAPGIAKAKLLFTKYHNTRNRGCLLKLVGVKFQQDKVLFNEVDIERLEFVAMGGCESKQQQQV